MKLQYSDLVDHIEDPVFQKTNDLPVRALSCITVRVKLSDTLSDEALARHCQRYIPRLNTEITKMVRESDALSKYRLPPSRVTLDTVLLNSKGRALEYHFFIEKLRIRRIKLAVYSPTGTSLAVAKLIGETIADGLVTLEGGLANSNLSKHRDASTPAGDAPAREYLTDRNIIDLYRNEFGGVGKDALCIISVPCEGGRLSKLVAERLDQVKGNGTSAIICVTYDKSSYEKNSYEKNSCENGSYKDALRELAGIVTENLFHVIAACGVLAEESAVQELDTGRPDAADRGEIVDFAEKVLWKIREGGLIYPPAFLQEKAGDEPEEQGKQRENAFFIGKSRFNLSSAKLVLLSAAEEAFDPAE